MKKCREDQKIVQKGLQIKKRFKREKPCKHCRKCEKLNHFKECAKRKVSGAERQDAQQLRDGETSMVCQSFATLSGLDVEGHWRSAVGATAQSVGDPSGTLSTTLRTLQEPSPHSHSRSS